MMGSTEKLSYPLYLGLEKIFGPGKYLDLEKVFGPGKSIWPCLAEGSFVIVHIIYIQANDISHDHIENIKY